MPTNINEEYTDSPRYIIQDGILSRVNADGSVTKFPVINASTYNKYKSSPYFIKTLDNAFSRFARRVENERKQVITLSGKTHAVKTSGGTYNIPVEIFDKIINSSKAAGIDPKQGLAIVIQESSGYTDPNRKNRLYTGITVDSNGRPRRYQWESVENQAGPSTIVSNWQYFTNNPYTSLLNGWEKSRWDVNRVNEDAKYQYRKHQSDYDNWDKNIDEDILTNMFRIPLNQINSGEKAYVDKIQDKMRTMSYKFGGQLNKKLIPKPKKS